MTTQQVLYEPWTVPGVDHYCLLIGDGKQWEQNNTLMHEYMGWLHRRDGGDGYRAIVSTSYSAQRVCPLPFEDIPSAREWMLTTIELFKNGAADYWGSAAWKMQHADFSYIFSDQSATDGEEQLPVPRWMPINMPSTRYSWWDKHETGELYLLHPEEFSLQKIDWQGKEIARWPLAKQETIYTQLFSIHEKEVILSFPLRQGTMREVAQLVAQRCQAWEITTWTEISGRQVWWTATNFPFLMEIGFYGAKERRENQEPHYEIRVIGILRSDFDYYRIHDAFPDQIDEGK